MKPVAAIRLVLATALIFLFSGTMAFAHEGHKQGAQIEQTTKAFSSALPAKASVLSATHLSALEFADRHDGVIVTVASSSGSDCDHGYCCCNGPSACGMSGCSAVALSTADCFVPRPLDSDKLTFEASDVRPGRRFSSLDRPPKA